MQRTKRSALGSSAGVPAGLAGALLAAGLAGCTWIEVEPAPPTVQPGPSEIRATGAPPVELPLDVETPGELELEVATSLAIRIAEVEGISAELAGVLFEPVTEPVERCKPSEPGVLNVRIATKGHRTFMEVVPGSSVDAQTRRCVLEALSVIDPAESLPPDFSATDEQPGFSSTLTISW